MAKKFNLGSSKDIKDLINTLRNVGRDQVKYGAEVIEEEFEKVLRSMQQNSRYTRAFKHASARVTVKEKTGGRDVVYTVTINDPIFFMLDEGTGKSTNYPIHASNYGLKAFPIRVPRSPGYEPGNRPMSQPNNLAFRQAVSNVPVNRTPSGDFRKIIFRPTIYRPIAPRNITDEVMKKVRKRLKDEGVEVTFEVKKERG